MSTTAVQVWLNDKAVGAVLVVHDPDCELTQIAASAHAALTNDAVFVVNGESVTTSEIKEWQA